MYSPREDSYLLSETLQKYLGRIKEKNISILDMGSGTGIQAETCRKLGFVNILAVDVDNDSVSFLKKKGFSAIKSNLFRGVNKKDKFDLIIFNPPYLPEDKYDKGKDTTGGKKGYETILIFLKNAKTYLNKEGRILLLFSSLSNPVVISKRSEEIGYVMRLLSKKKFSFEELYVFESKIK